MNFIISFPLPSRERGQAGDCPAGYSTRFHSWSGSAFARLLLSCLLFLCGLASAPTHAGDPPASPILRIETGRHTAFIESLEYDARRNRLITISDDKTVRVWQLPQVHPVATWRIPIAPGHEGQLYAVALSPDGNTLAVGGWTGWDWDNKACIYLLDAETGEILRRQSGFEEAIGALAYSPDGTYLAVGLLGKQGLHVLKTADYAEVAWDLDYLDKILDLKFAADGQLVSTSLDGHVRLYDDEFNLIGRVKSGLAGTQPFGARFSPDGTRIALGFHDVPAVSVLAAEDLRVLYSTPASELREQVNLITVTWSADGQYLYAGGDYRGAGAFPVYRWRAAGPNKMERFAAAEARISQVYTLPDGDIIYIAEDPAIGVLEPGGKRRLYLGSEVADYRDGQAAFRVSQDGTTIQFGYERGGKKPGQFSVLDQAFRADAPAARNLRPPLQQAPGIAVTGWKNAYQPALNGTPLALDSHEMARSYAIAPDKRQVLLGTEWALRLYDKAARQKWWVRLPGIAWAVNVSGDNQYALAALSDGTIRWYRMSDGAEVMTFFPHRNRKEWIAWIPRGYYMSSLYGDNYIGWQINRDTQTTPDFYRAVQFERVLYRPDLVAGVFKTKTRGLSRATDESMEGLGTNPWMGEVDGAGSRPSRRRREQAVEQFDISQLPSIAPPRIRIESVKLDERAKRPTLKLKFSADRNSLPMSNYAIYVNNVPVTPRKDRHLGMWEKRAFSRELELDVQDKVNNIRIEVFNDKSMGMLERSVLTQRIEQARPPVGDLYLLAIGVNQFPKLDQEVNLVYAAQDAEEIARRLQEAGKGYYNKIHAKVLSDNSAIKPERAQVLEALEFIQEAQGEDTVMVFLASHGISDNGGNYYFVPRDAEAADVQSVISGDPDAPRPSLLSWVSFFDALRNTAGKRILIVDTCQAKNIEGRFDAHALVKRSASSQFTFVLASKGGEESQEYAEGKHGLFTYALMAGLGAAADANRDGLVSVNEWFNYSVPVVEKLRDKTIGPQTPQLLAPEPLGGLPVVRVSAVR